MTPHGANGAAWAIIIRSAQLLRRDHAIAQPLVRTLLMVVRHVLAHELAQMTLAERAHAVQALPADRLHKPLREGVQVRAHRRQPHRLHARALQHPGQRRSKQRSAVVTWRAWNGTMPTDSSTR
jgi:hypothetical protein